MTKLLRDYYDVDDAHFYFKFSGNLDIVGVFFNEKKISNTNKIFYFVCMVWGCYIDIGVVLCVYNKHWHF